MNPVNTEPYKLPSDAAWLITGCSSGIGRAIAELIASKPGQRLIATARTPADLSYLPEANPNILKLALDVTSPSSVNAAFSAAAEHFGKDFHLDVVINNAGYSLSGDTESATEEETHQEMETLFFGTARVTTRAIEVMRQAENHRGGVIFNMSSLAGLCAFPGHAYYHAGKFAVEGWSEAVAREMHPDWNINFCIVEPSGVKTNFEGHSKGTRNQDRPVPQVDGEVETVVLADLLSVLAARDARLDQMQESKSQIVDLADEVRRMRDRVLHAHALEQNPRAQANGCSFGSDSLADGFDDLDSQP